MENPEKDHPGMTVSSKPSVPDEARIAKINSDAGSTKQAYNSLSDADPNVVFSVSHTTRDRRGKEVDGVDYHFVSNGEFQRLVDAGAFLEWAEYNAHRYGTSFAAVEASLREGRDVLLEIEVQGARQVRRRRSDARSIFLLPPSLKVLEERLRRRGTDSD